MSIELRLGKIEKAVKELRQEMNNAPPLVIIIMDDDGKEDIRLDLGPPKGMSQIKKKRK